MSLFSLLKSIAVALGPDWSVDVEPTITQGARLVRSDGLRLWCRLDAKRLSISPESVPMLTDAGHPTTYHYDRPVITVDPARPATRLAADIRRRLLPLAEAWWRNARTIAAESCKKWNDFLQRREELLSLGASHIGHDDVWLYGYGWRCDARYQDSVRFEFNGAYADVIAALKAIRAERNARQQEEQS